MDGSEGLTATLGLSCSLLGNAFSFDLPSPHLLILTRSPISLFPLPHFPCSRLTHLSGPLFTLPSHHLRPYLYPLFSFRLSTSHHPSSHPLQYPLFPTLPSP